jgi:hypothetical protein
MSKYQTEKEQVRQDVINQLDVIFYPGISQGELIDVQSKLYKIAKKYGLVREFKENGIL